MNARAFSFVFAASNALIWMFPSGVLKMAPATAPSSPWTISRSSWEWGDVVAAGFGVPVRWSVWWRCGVLRVALTPLGDGVVVRVTHDAQLSCP